MSKKSKTQITKYSVCTTHKNLQNKFGKKTKLRKKYAVAFIISFSFPSNGPSAFEKWS